MTKFPSWLQITDGLLIDSKKRVIIHPQNSRLKEYTIPEEIVERYNDWFDRAEKNNRNIVFQYHMPTAKRNIKLLARTITPVEDGIAYTSTSKRHEKSNVASIIHNRKTLYLIHLESGTPQTIGYNEANELAERHYSTNNEFTTNPLESVYDITEFSKTFRTINIENDRKYNVDVKPIVSIAAAAYHRNMSTIQAPLVTHAKFLESSDKQYETATLQSYKSGISKWYKFLLNLDKFQAHPRFEVGSKCVELSTKLRDQMLNLDLQNSTSTRIIDRIILIQELMGHVVQDPNLFAMLLKACFFDDDRNIIGSISCLRVMNSVRFFTRMILSFTKESKWPTLYVDGFHTGSVEALMTMQDVFDKLRTKDKKPMTNSTVFFRKGVYVINNIEISQRLIKDTFAHFFKGYEAALIELQKVHDYILPTVAEVNRRISTDYTNMDHSFRRGLSVRERNHFNDIIRMPFAPRHIDRLLQTLNNMTYQIIELISFTSGGALRAVDFSKLTLVGPDRCAWLDLLADGTPIFFFATKANTGRNDTERYIVCNAFVTKYVLHYFLIIKTVMHALSQYLVMDTSCFSFESIVSDFDFSNTILEDLMALSPYDRISAPEFIDKYAFVAFQPDREHGHICTRIKTEDISEALREACGIPGAGVRVWRQLFMKISEQGRFNTFLELAQTLRETQSDNSGSTALTELFNYGRTENFHHYQGVEAYQMSMTMMRFINEELFRDYEETGIGASIKPVEVKPVLFSPEQVNQAAIERLPGKTLRVDQMGIATALGMANHCFALQAPTGFGKTLLFSVILHLFATNKRQKKKWVNCVVTPSCTNMSQRLEAMGFTVGNLTEASEDEHLEDVKDVYVGVYDSSIVGILDRIQKPGLMVLDEAHVITDEDSNRDSLRNIHKSEVARFRKVLLISATLPSTMAKRVVGKLGIQSNHVYSSAVQKIPIDRIYAQHKNFPRDNTINVYVTELIKSFSKEQPDKKAIIFCQTKKDVESFQNNCLTIHDGMSNTVKESVLNKFKHNVDERFLVGTKLLNNGFDVEELRLIVFYKYVPKDLEMIQSIGLIRGRGLVLFLNNLQKRFCVQEMMQKYYNLAPLKTHDNCCGNTPPDPSLDRLRRLLIEDENMKDDHLNITDRMMELKEQFCNTIDIRSDIFADFVYPEETRVIFIELENDPIFLFCWEELKLSGPGTFTDIAYQYLENVMCCSVDTQLSLFVSCFNKYRGYRDAFLNMFESKMNECKQSHIKALKNITAEDEFDYNQYCPIKPVLPVSNACPNCFMRKHGPCNRGDASVYLYKKRTSLRSVPLQGTFPPTGQSSMYSLWFLTQFVKVNGVLNLFQDPV